ncbi:MAG: hypothetical protein Q9220_004954 [cf. Caloplaca sp. 1 TL-2023]
MAPTKTVRSKHAVNKSGRSKDPRKSAESSAIVKSRKSKNTKSTPPKQHQPRSVSRPLKPKKRVYTEKELGLPKLNTITPVGVDLPKGKKKGKIFVDDAESMMTILAIVNAEKEGQIESKVMKSRQMEEIREARRKEAESRQQQKQSKLEETKDSLRRSRKRKSEVSKQIEPLKTSNTRAHPLAVGKKRVSFA